MEKYIDQGIQMALEYAPKLAMALVTLIIGLWVIKWIGKIFDKSTKKMDASLRPFLRGILTTLLKVLLVISVASMVGIATTSFVAVLGAAGLAIGMALQGSLGNFAGGVLLLILRPFKVGDLITAQGHTGVVKEISVFCTVLLSVDNVRVILPNGPLAGGTIENLTTEDKRRVDMTFGIGYGDSIDGAKSAIKEVMDANDKILKDPGVDIFVNGHGDSSVNFCVRPWCKPEHYWDVYFYTHEQLKKKFDEKGISIPFPQRDVHLFQVKA